VSGPLIYVDTSDVRDGALAELKDAIGELARHAEWSQRQMITYRAFFTADGDRMTIVHMHPDASSLDRVMTLAAGSMPCDSAWPSERVDAFERWATTGMAP
jgi:hypothetical protein